MNATEVTLGQLISVKLPQNIYDANDADHSEVMNVIITDAFIDLDTCFRVRVLPDNTEDWARVGVVENYTPIQLSLTADFCAYKFLSRVILEASQLLTTNDQSARILIKAEAGSVSSTFEQRKEWLTAMTMKAKDLIDLIAIDIIRKSGMLGCGIANVGSGKFVMDTEFVMPIITIRDNNCGC